jgi:hypothetical protein
MRNPIVFGLYVLSVFVITSCVIDEELIPLAGTWRLDSTSGGFGGGGFPINNDILMIIEGEELIWSVDGTTSYLANLCHEEGEFYDILVIKKRSVKEPDENAFSLTERMGYQINEESLTLIYICNDCLSYHFVRIK